MTLSFGFEPQIMALLILRVVVLLIICRMSRLTRLGTAPVLRHAPVCQSLAWICFSSFPGLMLSGG